MLKILEAELPKRGFLYSKQNSPLFESYALIYHPYKIPTGEIITHKEAAAGYERQLYEKINKLIVNLAGIPLDELPNEKYDVNELLYEKLEAEKVEDHKIDEIVSKISSEIIKIVAQPFQEILETGFEQSNTKVFKEISWRDLYRIYGIEFTEKSNWTTLGQILNSGDYIIDQEMPEMDVIPISILKNIFTLLKRMQVDSVFINSYRQANLISLKDDGFFEKNNISFVASLDRDWIFLNPYDSCRTIVGGKLDFVKDIINSNLFEISDLLDENLSFFDFK
jgi:hypothetical protein